MGQLELIVWEITVFELDWLFGKLRDLHEMTKSSRHYEVSPPVTSPLTVCSFGVNVEGTKGNCGGILSTNHCLSCHVKKMVMAILVPSILALGEWWQNCRITQTSLSFNWIKAYYYLASRGQGSGLPNMTKSVSIEMWLVLCMTLPND